jgi:predicted  nucleic acid-binding Zn-ribbon protein
MDTKALHKQKLQAQLDEWKADIAKLKAKATSDSADAQIAMKKQFADLETHVEEAQAKMAELGEASEEAWDTLKTGAESTWLSLKTAVGDAMAKFKS